MTRMSHSPDQGAGSTRPANPRGVDPFAEAAQLLDVTAHEHPGGIVLVVVGEVDITTSPLLQSRIETQLGARPEVLVLDLSRVGFLASSGLAVLVEARKKAQATGVTLQVLATERAILRPLAATGLLDLFDIVTDISAVQRTSA